jgi:hypothetical protein
MDISNLFKDGILVQVHVRFWSGQCRLTPQDLGISPNQVSSAFRLGSLYLVKEEHIREFRVRDGRARRVVDENGFSFPIGKSRFVPKARLDQVVEQLEAHRDQILTLRDELLAKYEERKAEMLPVYREAARVAFNNLEDSSTEFSIEGREDQLEEFTQNFIARIEKAYPSESVLRGKFDISWTVFEVTPPSDKVQYASEKWKEAISEQMETFVGDSVRALRSEALEVVNRVHEALAGGKVHGKTLNSLGDFIKKFRELNFVGDQTVEDQLESLRKEVLEVYPLQKIKDEPEIQQAIKTRLIQIRELASSVDDIEAISQSYQHRRVIWQDGDDTEPQDQPSEE